MMINLCFFVIRQQVIEKYRPHYKTECDHQDTDWWRKSVVYQVYPFDKTQADLNWENPKVRQEVVKLLEFWAEKGVSGFRMDVINLISKDQRFLSDDRSSAPGDGRNNHFAPYASYMWLIR